MSRNPSELLTEALALSVTARAEIARALIDSLELDDESALTPQEIETAWEAEIEKRDAEFDANPNIGVPADLVFAEAQQRLQEIRKLRDIRRPA